METINKTCDKRVCSRFIVPTFFTQYDIRYMAKEVFLFLSTLMISVFNVTKPFLALNVDFGIAVSMRQLATK